MFVDCCNFWWCHAKPFNFLAKNMVFWQLAFVEFEWLSRESLLSISTKMQSQLEVVAFVRNQSCALFVRFICQAL
jgi:hypothetical protein